MTDFAREYANRAGKITRTANDYLTNSIGAISHLNETTFDHVLHDNNKYFELFLEVKKPEDMIILYTEMTSRVGREVNHYTQGLLNIVSETSAEALKLYHTVGEEAVQSGETIKRAVGAKRKGKKR